MKLHTFHATGKRSRHALEQELQVKVALMQKSVSTYGFQYEEETCWYSRVFGPCSQQGMTNMMAGQSQRVVQHCVISFPVEGPLKLLKPQEIKHVPHMCTTSKPIMPINMKNASKCQIFSSHSCHDPCDLLCWQLLSRLTTVLCKAFHSVCGGSLFIPRGGSRTPGY